MVQCENWWTLAKQFASRSPPLHLLSSPIQRTLMKALVLGGFAHMDSDTKQQYWAEVSAHLIHFCLGFLCSMSDWVGNLQYADEYFFLF